MWPNEDGWLYIKENYAFFKMNVIENFHDLDVLNQV